LFADRARQLDAAFALTGESPALVAQIVARLDGMPLAIELAAARAEALGLPQLLERLDHRFALLTGGDRTAAPRQRSLAATVDWSYQLLTGDERRVFRRLAVFPGPFTLEAAQAAAGAAAEPAVLHLVDCSLLTPPRSGPDGRVRYLMLETLRAYGLERLAETGERAEADAALTGYALQVAERAAAGLETGAGELPAARLVEAEDATVHQGLAWALDRDHATAARLAIALAPWWWQRGRWTSGYQLLAAAADRTAPGGEEWCAAQYWLGMLASGLDMTTSFGHLTAARDALAGRAPGPLLARTLAWRAGDLANLGRLPEAAEEGGRALAMARELGDRPGEAQALLCLATAAGYAGDFHGCVTWLRQAQRIDRAAVPGGIIRMVSEILAQALIEVGEVTEAQQHCEDLLAQAREAGAVYDQAECLMVMARLDCVAGRLVEARAHLRESLQLSPESGASTCLINCLMQCGHLCAAERRWRETITVWSAHEAIRQVAGFRVGESLAEDAETRETFLRARNALGPAQARAADERGAAMTPATAAEYALLLVTEEPDEHSARSGLPQLSARELELVTLVAQGRTDAQIAGQLYISVSTVRSHLDRIRDKTGCRRRADLTRLALQTGLV
jgi:DNA-binding CsgD family transcriptional regulator